MIDVLKKVIGRIESMSPNSSEAQVRKSLIEPIIQALGWETDDPEQCLVEYSLQQGRVDYALCRGADYPMVFIEAKKLGNVSEDGQDQLFRYAYGEGIRLLILTDGDIWNFYLTRSEANNPAERRFYRINLSENREKTAEYARYFEDYLKKDRIYSGDAIKVAEARHDSDRERNRAKKSILKVWKAMLDEPDPGLRDILSQAVEDKCGTKPDSDDLDSFLKGQISHHTSPPVTRPVPSLTPTLAEDRSETKPARRKPGKKPPREEWEKIIGYIYKGEKKGIGIRDGKKILIEIIKEFDNLPGFMDTFDRKTKPKGGNCVVARRGEDVYGEKSRAKVRLPPIDIGNGWYLHAKMTNGTIIRSVKAACEVAGVKYNHDLKLVFENERSSD